MKEMSVSKSCQCSFRLMTHNVTVQLVFMPMSPTTCFLCLQLRNCMNSKVSVLNKQLVATNKIINLVAMMNYRRSDLNRTYNQMSGLMHIILLLKFTSSRSEV